MAQASMLTEMVQKFVTATPDIQGAACRPTQSTNGRNSSHNAPISCTAAGVLVLASKEAKQGLLFLEIKRIVKELAPMMG